MLSSTHLCPIKITCDAPVYEVVQASGRLGMRSPEDVRWCRKSAPKSDVSGRKSLAGRIWRLLFAFDVPDVEETCGCGHTLPERRFVVLRRRSGSEVRYSLTQCGRCRTIHWEREQASPASPAFRET
jgi:hypothetical protein